MITRKNLEINTHLDNIHSKSVGHALQQNMPEFFEMISVSDSQYTIALSQKQKIWDYNGLIIVPENIHILETYL